MLLLSAVSLIMKGNYMLNDSNSIILIDKGSANNLEFLTLDGLTIKSHELKVFYYEYFSQIIKEIENHNNIVDIIKRQISENDEFVHAVHAVKYVKSNIEKVKKWIDKTKNELANEMIQKFPVQVNNTNNITTFNNSNYQKAVIVEKLEHQMIETSFHLALKILGLK